MKLDNLTCISEKIDIDKYINFRKQVKETMLYPEWLGDFNKEDIINMLNNNAKIWIYYLDNKPICSMILIPSDVKTLLKFNLDLDYQKVVDYGPLFVDSKFRGCQLQLQMLKELDKYAIALGYKYAVTTVHPDNIYSINNLVKDGFKLINTKELKRGIRNIYLKKLVDF